MARRPEDGGRRRRRWRADPARPTSPTPSAKPASVFPASVETTPPRMTRTRCAENSTTYTACGGAAPARTAEATSRVVPSGGRTGGRPRAGSSSSPRRSSVGWIVAPGVAADAAATFAASRRALPSSLDVSQGAAIRPAQACALCGGGGGGGGGGGAITMPKGVQKVARPSAAPSSKPVRPGMPANLWGERDVSSLARG